MFITSGVKYPSQRRGASGVSKEITWNKVVARYEDQPVEPI